MKKKIFPVVFILFVAVLFVSDIMADDNETDYECCCNLMCKWEFTVLNPACVLMDSDLSGTISVNYSGCDSAGPDDQANCESEGYADKKCRETAGDVWDQINLEQKDALCPDAQIPLFGTKKYIGTDNTCYFDEEDCPFMFLLGDNDPRLETLRQFRDEVLSSTGAGRKLTDLYYDNSEMLVMVFKENPSLKQHAVELLDKLMPFIQATLGNRNEAPPITDDIYNDVSDLLDEIDSATTNPLKEKITDL